MTDRDQYAESAPTLNRVWEGPRTKISRFEQGHWLVQIGWWLEPEATFLPITEPLRITGSASPVYVEDGD